MWCGPANSRPGSKTTGDMMPASQVATLANDVKGRDHVLMSPYPNLKSAVSLQAWGYQLFVPKVTDPRIARFIGTLAANPAITPELEGGSAITCANPDFKNDPSTFGHPQFAPPAGGSGGTMTTAP